MKILNSLVLVVGQLGNGGLERQLSFLIPALQRNGVEVRCVVWNYNVTDAYAEPMKALLGHRLIGLETSQSSLYKLITLRKLLKKHRPDMVLSFSTFINLPVYLSSLGICPSVGSLRTSARLYANTGGKKARLNLKYPPKILANSQRAIAELHLMYPKVKAAYLQNTIDIGQFKKAAETKTGTVKSSVSVGNVRGVKRLDRMLDVFQYLKKQGHDGKHTHIGGGSGLQELKARATEMGLDGVITFAGPKTNVKELLPNFELFLHFAEYEGSPNVIMEAMAAGLAIVTTDCGDATSYVRSGHNGYVIHPFSAQEYAYKYNLLMNDSNQRTFMVQNSLEMIANSDVSNVDRFFLEGINALGYTYQYPGKKM